MWSKLIFPLMLVSISQMVCSQQVDFPQRDSLNAFLKSYIADDSPGFAVGIAKDGAILYEGYFGYAELEHKAKIGKATRFNIASNAKQFTALCVLKLIDEKVLDLDDDIRDYLPELYPKIEDEITISQLLTHTSGIRDVYDLWALQGKTWWKLFINNNDALELLKNQSTLNFKPGTAYTYSNSNYILLATLIEKATGMEFDQYAQELFRSMGMEETSFLTNYMDVIPNRARPYGNWSGWKEYPFITETHGDGALFTTLEDQLIWETTLQNKKTSALTANILERSQEPIKNASISTYGFGLMFDTYKGLKYAYHDGSTGAYNASFFRFPEFHLSIVVVSNNANISSHYIAQKITDMVLGLEAKEEVYPSGPDRINPIAASSEIVGTYRSEEGTIIEIERRNDSLFRKIYQRDIVALIQEEGTLFQYANNPNLKMAFEKDGETVTGFTIYLATQQPIRYKKLPEFHRNHTYGKSLEGTFVNDETQTEITIKYKDDKYFEIVKNGRQRKAELVYKDLIRMNGYEIAVHRTAAGEINGLVVKMGRIKNILFKKL